MKIESLKDIFESFVLTGELSDAEKLALSVLAQNPEIGMAASHIVKLWNLEQNATDCKNLLTSEANHATI